MPTRKHALMLSVGLFVALVAVATGGMRTGASGQAPPPKTPIKIGVLSPLTGPLAALARDVVDGARLYGDEVHGEMAGRKVELIVACVAGGGMLGFLYGVPKVLQDETPKPGGYRQLVNTNLDQISDWLTKVAVGLTLVNARDISKSLQGTAGVLAKALGTRNPRPSPRLRWMPLPR